MDAKTETKPRSEAPLAALILGAVAFATAFIATTPGIPLIAGAIGTIAGLVEIGVAQRDQRTPNKLAIIGVVLAVVGIVIGFLTAT